MTYTPPEQAVEEGGRTIWRISNGTKDEGTCKLEASDVLTAAYPATIKPLLDDLRELAERWSRMPVQTPRVMAADARRLIAQYAPKEDT